MIEGLMSPPACFRRANDNDGVNVISFSMSERHVKGASTSLRLPLDRDSPESLKSPSHHYFIKQRCHLPRCFAN